jgi:hypothetical protein
MYKIIVREPAVYDEKEELISEEKLAIDIHPDVKIDDDTYSTKITIGLHDEFEFIPDFSKDIDVIHSQEENGYDVDKKRQKEIKKFLTKQNK